MANLLGMQVNLLGMLVYIKKSQFGYALVIVENMANQAGSLSMGIIGKA